MSLLPQSALLEALGWTIVNSTWQFGFLWIIWLLIQKVWPRITASNRYNLAILLLLAGTCWAFAGFLTGVFRTTAVSSIRGESSSFSNGFSSIENFPSLLLPYLSVLYILWLAVKLFQLFTQFRLVKKLGEPGLEKLPVKWRIFAEDMAAQMNLTKKLNIWISNNIDTPILMGWLKPVILLPATVLSQLSAAQLEAILIHEFAHIKRNDYIWNWIVSIIETLFFFNPFVKSLASIIKEEREHACDDWVLQFPFQPQQYAQALLLLEQKRGEDSNSIILAARGTSKKLLLTRVQRMLNIPITNQNKKRPGFAFLTITVAVLFASFPFTPASRNILSEFIKPSMELNDRLFQGLNYRGIRFEGTIKANIDHLSGMEATNLTSETNIDKSELSIEIQNIRDISDNIDTVSNTTDLDIQFSASDASVVEYLPLQVAEFQALPVTVSYTFDKEDDIRLPEEASLSYMLPYVPRKSFETTITIDTTPALQGHLNAGQKAREAAMQTQVALDKINWDKLSVELQQLASAGAKKEELQQLLEIALAKLNWNHVQEEAASMLKQLSEKQIEQQMARFEILQEVARQQEIKLNKLNEELHKAEQILQNQLKLKSEELKIKEEKLRKKHKIVHI